MDTISPQNKYTNLLSFSFFIFLKWDISFRGLFNAKGVTTEKQH